MKEHIEIIVKKTKVSEYGRTNQDITLTFGSSGGLTKHTVTVPKDTLCIEIEREPENFFVQDLSWIPNTAFMCRHDATHYGIRINRKYIRMV